MSNILDYIDWRGDLTFNQSPFNEIDSLIISRLSYLPFELILKESDSLTIKEAKIKFSHIKNFEEKVLWKDDLKLINLLSKSNRFSDSKLTNFVISIDKKEEKQFSAITILLPDNTIYVSFRGTDNTIVGWKEDFNMGFFSHIPSQISSIKYLEHIASLYPYPIRIGGHSKGGNLAIYSSIYVSLQIQNRIISIDNNDGPGFNEDIIQSIEYQRILNKINTYIPQSSVVGMLLNHGESYNIIKSSAKGLMQHDAYSWQLIGTNFIKMNKITNSSKIIDQTLKSWTKDTTPKQREEILNILFEIFNSTNIDTFHELSKNWYKTAITLIKSYKNIDSQSKEILNKTINSFAVIIKNNLFEK